MEKSASIITIGNEILKGRTVNTNFAVIGRMLTFSGYRVRRGYICEDSPEEIAEVFRDAVSKSDLVVSSGGLGPTFDDMTVDSVAKAFSLKMVRNDHIALIIRNHYTSLNVPVTPEREKMSMVPEGSRIIENPVGSAPGVVLDIDKCRIILLPGVPTEMEALLSLARDEYVSDRTYCEKSSIFENMMESTLAPEITRIMRKYDGRVYIKSHPLNTEGTLPRIDVEVSAYSDDLDHCTKLVKDVMDEIKRSSEKLVGR